MTFYYLVELKIQPMLFRIDRIPLDLTNYYQPIEYRLGELHVKNYH